MQVFSFEFSVLLSSKLMPLIVLEHRMDSRMSGSKLSSLLDSIWLTKVVDLEGLDTFDWSDQLAGPWLRDQMDFVVG